MSTDNKKVTPKKRSRKPSESLPDKKLKKGTGGAKGGTTGGMNGVTAPVVAPAVMNGNGTLATSSPGTSRKVVPPPAHAFTTPAIKKSQPKEDTPYQTAVQSQPAPKRQKPSSTNQAPAKLVPKLDAVKEEPDEKIKVVTKVKVVRRGSLFCTTFLLFLWIISSAILASLFLMEKISHDLNVWKLQEELRDAQLLKEEKGPTSPDIEAMASVIETWKEKAQSLEHKLVGYEKQFQDSLAKLESSSEL